VAGGIEERKIVRVVGLGSAVLLDRTDPFNPSNRRISVTVLNQRAEKRILDDGPDGASPADADPAAAPPAGAAPAVDVGLPAAGAGPALATPPVVDAVPPATAAPKPPRE